MNTYQDAQLDALGDATRRAIIARLADGPLPVGELARDFPMSRPAISQHLRVLKHARLVVDRAEGSRRMYTLNPDAFDSLRAHFDRYVIPLVPALAVLAGRQRALAPLTLALLIVPLVWAIGDDARLTRTDTRVVAHAWIDSHLPAGATVAAESSTPELEGHPIVGLALPGPGRPFDPDRNVARLRAEGVSYVLVTGAIADRVLAARDHYPREARFYDQLKQTRRVYHVQAGHGLTGPWVSVYRL